MNRLVAQHPNTSFAFHLYDFHKEGLSAKELASVYALPVSWVEEYPMARWATKGDENGRRLIGFACGGWKRP
jgi:hypothetical protein